MRSSAILFMSLPLVLISRLRNKALKYYLFDGRWGLRKLLLRRRAKAPDGATTKLLLLRLIHFRFFLLVAEASLKPTAILLP